MSYKNAILLDVFVVTWGLIKTKENGYNDGNWSDVFWNNLGNDRMSSNDIHVQWRKKSTASETEIAKEALWEQKTFTCNDIKTQRFQKAKMAKVRFGNKWDGLEGRSHLIYGAFLRRGHVIRIHEI